MPGGQAEQGLSRGQVIQRGLEGGGSGRRYSRLRLSGGGGRSREEAAQAEGLLQGRRGEASEEGGDGGGGGGVGRSGERVRLERIAHGGGGAPERGSEKCWKT